MSVTDTDATERVEPEPDVAEDPSLSPVVDHSAVSLHSPVPRVVAHHAPAPETIDHAERAPRGVKLAKISKTGDRVFRSLATTSGLAKRVPRSAGATRAIPGSEAERGVGATRRSPEEIRSMLAQHSAGRQRARTQEPVPSGGPDEREAHD